MGTHDARPPRAAPTDKRQEEGPIAANARILSTIGEGTRGRRLLGDRALLVHVVAFGASLALTALARPSSPWPIVAFATTGFLALVVARGAARIRSTATVTGLLSRLVDATPYLVGAGLALAMVVSGAPDSPLLPLAVAAAWEAGRRSQASAVLHAALFAGVYLAGAAVDGLRLPESHPELLMEIAKTVGLVGLGAAVGAAFARRQGEVAAMAFVLERSAEERADVRAKLARALRDEPLPVDSLVAGAHLGLTVRETELLGFLLMGLTNLEIADAACVSEATVKYRLTRLYRKLGVARRPHAIQLARELGFGPPEPPE